MGHYAKLAAMIIRVLGVIIALIGVMGFIYWGLAGLFLEQVSPERMVQGARLLSSTVFILVGAIVFVLGRPLGRLIGKGLD